MTTKDHLQIAKTLAKLLDSQLSIGRFKFGLDPIIGLIPWFGDILTLSFSFYLYWLSFKLNLPGHAKAKILTNILIDFLLSIIPFVGDLGDFVWRANARNWEIIQKHARIKDNVQDAEIVD